MIPKYYDIDPADVDRDGIAEAQQLVGAGNLTLNGALADLGTAGQFDIGDSYSTGIGGVQLSVYSAGNIATVIFTFTGKDENGNSITDTVTGVNNSTVETTKYFSQCTRVAASAAVGSNVEVGTVDEIITKTIPLNWRADEPVTYAISNLTGTCQFDIDETFDSLANGSESLSWITKLSNQTADSASSGTLHAKACRLKFDSYTNGAELQFSILID